MHLKLDSHSLKIIKIVRLPIQNSQGIFFAQINITCYFEKINFSAHIFATKNRIVM